MKSHNKAFDLIEHDIYVKMPPRKKYSIKARITRIRKAVPRRLVQEGGWIDENSEQKTALLGQDQKRGSKANVLS